MKAACSDSRNNTAAATSSTPGKRFSTLSLQRLLAMLRGKRQRHLGQHHARRHRVDGDAARAELARRGLGQRHQPGLRGRVVGLAELAAQAVDRHHIDDAAEARRHHTRPDRPDQVEGTGQIDVEHRPPLIVGHFGDAAVAGDAGIVDQQIHPRPQAVQRRRHRRGFGDVDGMRLDARKPWLDGTVEHMNARAAGPQPFGDGAPDAAPAAGDHRGAAAKVPSPNLRGRSMRGVGDRRRTTWGRNVRGPIERHASPLQLDFRYLRISVP